MYMLRVFLTTSAVLALLCACQNDTSGQTFEKRTTAEQMGVSFKDFGDYVLHFNSIPTDMLEPDIARQYSISRSKNRALLTVSIIQSVAGAPDKSVLGEVTATVNNLTGQNKEMTLRQIREGDSIYYIGDVAVANSETLVFNISATPENETDSFDIRFMRQFYTD